jgi:hypothetical protein
LAAHIHGAAPLGPRYDPSQSTDERKAIENGIWVCHSCSDTIDKDTQTYPAEVLRECKVAPEAWVLGGEIVPKFPVISLTTQLGLFVPPVGAAIVDGTLTSQLRDHLVEIHAGSRHEIEQLVLRFQFPESLLGILPFKAPVGVAVDVREDRPQPVVHATGNARVEQYGNAHPTNHFLIEIERLGPSRPLSLGFRTALGEADAFARRSQRFIGRPHTLAFYVEGAFLYRDGDQFFERAFVCPIETPEERSYTLGDPEDPSARKRIHGNFNGQPTKVTVG